ncbi:DUF4913 domain-containing protein [Streptomyces sp. NPDC047049]|uniref:DUF4913 domain-containing protein n=1 Tax=Streptomyces sp. NPDC047049 TaxID=3156688 RepID=UPI0034094FF3
MADDTTTDQPAPEMPEGGDAPAAAAPSAPVPDVQDLAAQLRGLRSVVDGLEAFQDWAVPLLDEAEKRAKAGTEPQPDGTGGGGKDGKDKKPEEKPKPAFPHAVAWVEQWFIPTFQRKTGPGSLRWCRLWWAHAEAMVRFEALWRSWEVLRLDVGTGMGVWFRDHCDSQLPLLLGPDGPFAQCTADKHEPVPALPTVPVPAAVIDALTATDDQDEQDPRENAAEAAGQPDGPHQDAASALYDAWKQNRGSPAPAGSAADE